MVIEKIPLTTLSLGLCGGRLEIKLYANRKITKTNRRQLLLAILNGFHQAVAIRWASMGHSDSSSLNQYKEFRRPVSMHQACKLDTIHEQLGFNLRCTRLRRGLTQAQFSKIIGISRVHLSNIERGKLPISDRIMMNIEHSFGVTLQNFTIAQWAGESSQNNGAELPPD